MNLWRGFSRRWAPSVGIAPLALSFLLVWAGGALAQGAGGDVSALVTKIDQLERQLRTLEEVVFRGAPTPVSPAATQPAAPQGAGAETPAIAQLTFRVQQFESELQRLTGQIEEVQFQLRQVSERIDRAVSDIEFRLSEIERGGGAPPNPAEAADAGPAFTNEVTVALPEGTPEEQYRFAQNFLVQRDFVRAEKALRQFIEANPNNQLSGDAQFWLGETYFIRNQYERAARAYAEGYRSFPQSAQAPNNLLKLGIALGNLEQPKNACITLDQLIAEFPGAPTNVLQRATIERERLGCGS